jgi:hypothetical protein
MLFQGNEKGRDKIEMQGSPHSNKHETSMKAKLWAGITQSGLRLMTWCGGDGKPSMKPMKPRAFIGVDVV